MQSLPLSELRTHLAETLGEVEAAGEPLAISRRGQAVAVLMSMARFQALSGEQQDFVARLQSWRAQQSFDAETEDDPFAGVRDPSPGRDVDWPA